MHISVFKKVLIFSLLIFHRYTFHSIYRTKLWTVIVKLPIAFCFFVFFCFLFLPVKLFAKIFVLQTISGFWDSKLESQGNGNTVGMYKAYGQYVPSCDTLKTSEWCPGMTQIRLYNDDVTYPCYDTDTRKLVPNKPTRAWIRSMMLILPVLPWSINFTVLPWFYQCTVKK